MKVKSLERSGNQLRYIDQTALPVALVYKETGDYRQIIEAIKRLEIRGAPAIGIAAAYALAIATAKSGRFERAEFLSIAAELKTSKNTW